jgi:hypothetical protein
VSRYDEKELKRLVELEYDRTAKFVDGLISTQATVRGWAVTIWLAVLGVGFDRSVWELSALAAIVAVVFMIIDAYHAWLYGEALTLANELERIQGAAYDAVGRRATDPDADKDLRTRLESHRFGLYRNLKRFRPRDLLYARPRVFFYFFYPLLALVGVGAAVYIAQQKSPSESTCKVVAATHGRTIQCGKVVIVGNHVTTVP